MRRGDPASGRAAVKGVTAGQTKSDDNELPSSAVPETVSYIAYRLLKACWNWLA
jgi:hypothetical protein